VPLASIPSPGSAAWRLGPLPIRAYALCVTAGIVVALIVASRRYRRAGGGKGVILDVAAWAVPFGLAGAVAHALLVASRHDFTHIHHLWHDATVGVADIGIVGAVALGAAGAWIACRRADLPLGPVAGAAAPALLFGLAIASLGNWWTQAFDGPPSTWWWAVQIAPEHRASGYETFATFQPEFAYQALWDVLAGLAVIWVGRRFALTGERTFMLAAAAWAAGSFWMASWRIGPQLQVIGVDSAALGDILVFTLAVTGLCLTRQRPVPPARTPVPKALVDDSSG
jgi:prolipoprotein diacylglyceryltransferase